MVALEHPPKTMATQTFPHAILIDVLTAVTQESESVNYKYHMQTVSYFCISHQQSHVIIILLKNLRA
jgi:hypothetical protein